MANRKSLDPLVRIQDAAMTPMIEGIRLSGIIKLVSKYEEAATAINKVVDNMLIASANSLTALEGAFPDTELGNAMKIQAGTTKMQVTGKYIEKIITGGI